MRPTAFLPWIVLLAACGAPPAGDDGTDGAAIVNSSASEDVAGFNSRIDAAIAASDTWPQSAVLVAYTLVGGDSETRSMSIETSADSIEMAQNVTAIVIRDGFLDDSVRGDWHSFALERRADGAWRVATASRAQRCWRSKDEAFTADPCP